MYNRALTLDLSSGVVTVGFPDDIELTVIARLLDDNPIEESSEITLNLFSLVHLIDKKCPWNEKAIYFIVRVIKIFIPHTLADILNTLCLLTLFILDPICTCLLSIRSTNWISLRRLYNLFVAYQFLSLIQDYLKITVYSDFLLQQIANT